jgi:hypothetical protein
MQPYHEKRGFIWLCFFILAYGVMYMQRIHNTIIDAVLTACKALLAALLPGLAWGLVLHSFDVLPFPVTFTVIYAAKLIALKYTYRNRLL